MVERIDWDREETILQQLRQREQARLAALDSCDNVQLSLNRTQQFLRGEGSGHAHIAVQALLQNVAELYASIKLWDKS